MQKNSATREHILPSHQALKRMNKVSLATCLFICTLSLSSACGHKHKANTLDINTQIKHGQV